MPAAAAAADVRRSPLDVAADAVARYLEGPRIPGEESNHRLWMTSHRSLVPYFRGSLQDVVACRDLYNQALEAVGGNEELIGASMFHLRHVLRMSLEGAFKCAIFGATINGSLVAFESALAAFAPVAAEQLRRRGDELGNVMAMSDIAFALSVEFAAAYGRIDMIQRAWTYPLIRHRRVAACSVLLRGAFGGNRPDVLRWAIKEGLTDWAGDALRTLSYECFRDGGARGPIPIEALVDHDPTRARLVRVLDNHGLPRYISPMGCVRLFNSARRFYNFRRILFHGDFPEYAGFGEDGYGCNLHHARGYLLFRHLLREESIRRYTQFLINQVAFHSSCLDVEVYGTPLDYAVLCCTSPRRDIYFPDGPQIVSLLFSYGGRCIVPSTEAAVERIIEAAALRRLQQMHAGIVPFPPQTRAAGAAMSDDDGGGGDEDEDDEDGDDDMLAGSTGRAEAKVKEVKDEDEYEGGDARGGRKRVARGSGAGRSVRVRGAAATERDETAYEDDADDPFGYAEPLFDAETERRLEEEEAKQAQEATGVMERHVEEDRLALAAYQREEAAARTPDPRAPPEIFTRLDVPSREIIAAGLTALEADLQYARARDEMRREAH